MKTLFEKSIRKAWETELAFERFLAQKINWDHKLIAITGPRGVGKTTLVLQHLRKSNLNDEEKLYVSLDDIFFSKKQLVQLADEFVKLGGKLLILDEVHKYPNWSIEIKNIYDDYKDLQVIFTGSSILEIDKGKGDLSRRAVTYEMPVMSFREYLNFETGKEFSVYTIEEIIDSHIQIAKTINQQLRPLQSFAQYIEHGAYPFYKSAHEDFPSLLLSSIQTVLEVDLPAFIKIDYSHILKIKKLLLIISENVPFKPNISELSTKTEMTRETVLAYLDYLRKAQLINVLSAQNKGLRRFQKPEKIFLNNTNQIYALADHEPNTGTLRESFFLQQVSAVLQVNYTDKGDFLVAGKHTFEIGGKNKNYNQIANIENSYIGADNIEFGFKNKIPLWLFGFLY